MATVTTSTASNLLKTKYEPEFAKAFSEEAVGFQLATKKKRKFSGGTETFGVQMGRGKGVGFRGETQGLPTPGTTEVVQATVGLKRMYGVIELSHDVIELSKGDEAAFAEALGFEVENTFDRMKKYANQMFYGDGKGILATVSAGGSFASADASTLQVTVDTTRYLEPGDIITIWDDNTDTSGVLANFENTAETVIVYSVDSETTATIKRTAVGTGSAATVASGNVIRLYGDKSASTAAGNQAITGIGAFASTSGTFQNLSRSTYPRWQGQVINASGSSTNLDVDHLIKLNDAIRRKSGEKIDTLLWDISLRREYVNIVRPDIRYAPVKENDPGYSNESLHITLGDRQVRLIEDIDVPYGTVFGFPKQYLHWMELTPMQFDDTTGSVLKQATAYGSSGSGDKYWGFIRMKGNFATEKASCFGKIANLAYSLES